MVGRAVIGTRSRAAVVAAAGFQPFAMKRGDGGVVLGAERDMRAFARRLLVKMQPQRRRVLGAESGSAVVARAQLEAEWLSAAV